MRIEPIDAAAELQRMAIGAEMEKGHGALGDGGGGHLRCLRPGNDAGGGTKREARMRLFGLWVLRLMATVLVLFGIIGLAVSLTAKKGDQNVPPVWFDLAIAGAGAFLLLRTARHLKPRDVSEQAATRTKGPAAKWMTRTTADRLAQEELATPAPALKPNPDEQDLTPPLDLHLTVQTATAWTDFDRPTIRGIVFPDGSVTAVAITGASSTEAKPTRSRLSRDVVLDALGDDFDRCCVGLLRQAGVEAPIRLPYPIKYDTDGKAGRPTMQVTAEAIISYDDARREHSTRRISIFGFEPIGRGHQTDDVKLHAWCWKQKGYRTFFLSRITSLMDPAIKRQVNTVEWIWAKGGLKFPPADVLRARRH